MMIYAKKYRFKIMVVIFLIFVISLPCLANISFKRVIIHECLNVKDSTSAECFRLQRVEWKRNDLRTEIRQIVKSNQKSFNEKFYKLCFYMSDVDTDTWFMTFSRTFSPQEQKSYRYYYICDGVTFLIYGEVPENIIVPLPEYRVLVAKTEDYIPCPGGWLVYALQGTTTDVKIIQMMHEE